MISASAGSCGTAQGSVFGYLATSVLVGGLGSLYLIARNSGLEVPQRSRRRGACLIVLAMASVIAAAAPGAVHLVDRHVSCGGGVSAAVSVVFPVAVVLFLVGTSMQAGTEWVTIAAAVVFDLALLISLAGGHAGHRGKVGALLAVHALCTAVASHWSRAARGAAPVTRAKASEAGRVLAAGWLILFVLELAGAGEKDGLDSLVSDSSLARALRRRRDRPRPRLRLHEVHRSHGRPHRPAAGPADERPRSHPWVAEQGVGTPSPRRLTWATARSRSRPATARGPGLA